MIGNHLSALLDTWERDRHAGPWVLGTVFRTEGSAYRKAGAMMLIDGSGRRLGLLSGGCLEADIGLQARKVMESGRSVTLVYDGSDEDDLSFRLGIGCGGTVHILLQPITAAADLDLAAMAAAMKGRRPGFYHQRIPGPGGETMAFFQPGGTPGFETAKLEERDGQTWLVTPIRPDPHLLVVGGGIDAVPVVVMAKNLGWYVTVADPRPANARREMFGAADHILRDIEGDLVRHARDHSADAAILMCHSVDLDARALRALTGIALRHVALLGPRHRFHRVLEHVGLTEAALPWPVSGPAGWKLGGHLPESIALSILAECHAVLHGVVPARAGRKSVA